MKEQKLAHSQRRLKARKNVKTNLMKEVRREIKLRKRTVREMSAAQSCFRCRDIRNWGYSLAGLSPTSRKLSEENCPPQRLSRIKDRFHKMSINEISCPLPKQRRMILFLTDILLSIPTDCCANRATSKQATNQPLPSVSSAATFICRVIIIITMGWL